MKKVKSGDTVTIDGAEYVFDEGSSYAMNKWINWLEIGIEEEDNKLHLYTKDGKNSVFFSPSKIKEELERAEQNKSPHGL